MIYFRCYSCWKSLAYRNKRDYIICQCDAKLFVGKLKQETIDGTPSDPAEHKLLLQKLHDELLKNKNIYRGKTEIIAGKKIRHRPDAIYYRGGTIFVLRPIIYEIETCNSIPAENTISRCKLFSEVAHNLFSKFYLVVPKYCDGESGRELAGKILKENKIDIESIEIMVL